jgi:Ran GTPase-activating protein (RanGAP) involved in mRNA processing and transport
MNRLKTSNTLEVLNFSGNSLETEYKKFKILENFLTKNKSVKSLNLSGCYLQDDALCHIAVGLFKNEILQKLNLANNKFSGGGVS